MCDDVDWPTQLGLECAVQLAEWAAESRPVVLVDSVRSDWHVGRAIESLARLNSRKPCHAYIQRAEGSALLLALCCNTVVCSPTATLGRLAAFRTDGDADALPTVGACDEITIASLHALRPGLTESTVDRLMRGTMSGEEAEARGVVDVLVASDEAYYFFDRWNDHLQLEQKQ